MAHGQITVLTIQFSPSTLGSGTLFPLLAPGTPLRSGLDS